jgi:hypothetical protein
MNISHADDFCLSWDVWQRGRAEGLTMAIEMVEKQLCHEGTSEDGRESLGRLYASLLDLKLRRELLV